MVLISCGGQRQKVEQATTRMSVTLRDVGRINRIASQSLRAEASGDSVWHDASRLAVLRKVACICSELTTTERIPSFDLQSADKFATPSATSNLA